MNVKEVEFFMVLIRFVFMFGLERGVLVGGLIDIFI